MLTKHRGTDTLEWIVVTAIILGVIGTALWLLSSNIGARLQGMSTDLGAGGAE